MPVYSIQSITTVASQSKSMQYNPQCRPTIDNPYVGVPLSEGRVVPLQELKESLAICSNKHNQSHMAGCIYRYRAGPQSITTTWGTRCDAFLAPRCVVPWHLVEGRNLDRGLRQRSTYGTCSPPMQYLVHSTFTYSWQSTPRRQKIYLLPGTYIRYRYQE